MGPGLGMPVAGFFSFLGKKRPMDLHWTDDVLKAGLWSTNYAVRRPMQKKSLIDHETGLNSVI